MINVMLGVTVSAQKEKYEDVMRVIRPRVRQTRLEPGCIQCDLYQHVQSDSLILLERWQTMSDFERHVRSEEFREVLAWIDLSDTPPEIHFDTVSQSQGMELIKAIRETQSAGQGQCG